MTRNKKGFTLVELVIVIAVIAILAGVMIAVFSGVVKRAEESAKLQEMKNAEIASKADDILKKIDNAKWFGWEDLETKIGETITNTMKGLSSSSASNPEELKTAVTAAVDEAIAKYAVAQGTENTGLTAEQVKFIVEQAVSKVGGVTETQVRSIVNTAVAGITPALSKTQVQAIVDTAVAKVESGKLTAADLATALKNVATKEQVIEAVNSATATVSTLTAEEVEAIVAKYVTANGLAKGDFTWYNSEDTALTITADKATDSVVAIATLTASGESFEGKTITIEKVDDTTPATITLTEDWNPIKTFAGTLEGNGATVNGVDFEIVYFSTEEKQSTGTSAYLGLNSDGSWYGDKTGFGFINVLTGTVKDITVNYDMQEWSDDPNCKYTYFGGIAGSVNTDGAVIENCHVTGTIKAWGRVGGLVGYVKDCNVTIKNCSVSADISSRLSSATDNFAYASVAGYVGWHGKDSAPSSKITFEGTNSVSGTKLSVYNTAGTLQATGTVTVATVIANYGDANAVNEETVTKTGVTKKSTGAGYAVYD